MRSPDRSGERGSITLGLVVLVLALFAAVGLVVDGGAKVAAVQHATRLAGEAARAGAQHVDVATVQTQGSTVLDPSAARFAAQAVLRDAGISGSVTVQANAVQVSASVSRPTVFLGLFGIGSVTGTGSAESGLTLR